MYWIIGFLAAGIFTADFFIKSYLRQHFAYQSIPIIPDIFHMTVVFNKGIAFGLLREHTIIVTYATILFLVVFSLFIKKESRKNTLFFIACGLILGGALSNLYDRITLGFVVDYIDIRIWPVFNLSDSSICVGAGLLFIQTFKDSKQKKIA